MQNHSTIKHWAEDDRPREKMLLKGKNALSDSEIIAILLGSGTRDKTAVELAQEILSQHNNDLHALGRSGVKDLSVFKGMGAAKSLTLMAALELGRRRKKSDRKKKTKITGSQAVFDLLSPYFEDLSHEEFYVIYLNRSNVVLHVEQVSKGGVSGTIADGKIIFKLALMHQASALILAHNHPSGALKPSEPDIRLTKDFRQFGKMIGIEVLDHLIFTDNGYLSLADENIAF
ncbi:DNA repair protein RadC [Crocinitomicaceae bacterium]|jgi:DNA repair protein RadC|nr:DNA repair protein RadC [Crocinitomicaceae bacterium]